MNKFLKLSFGLLAVTMFAAHGLALAADEPSTDQEEAAASGDQESAPAPADQAPLKLNQYIPTDETSGYIDVGNSQPVSQEPEDEETKKQLEELKEYVEDLQRSTQAGRDGQAAAEASRTVSQVRQAQQAQRSYKF